MKKVMYSILFVILLVSPAPSSALLIQDGLGGYANFTMDNATTLRVDLYSQRQATVNSEVLTAVFFSSGATLIPVSATIPAGSALVYNTYFETQGSDLPAGGEWAYRSGLAGQLPGGGNIGISTAGFGIFGPHDLIGGVDLNGTQAPGGGDFGLIGWNTSTAGNGYEPLINSHTFFTFAVPGGFNPNENISNVYLQYGTTLASVPEPTTMLLLGFGLIGLAASSRKFRK